MILEPGLAGLELQADQQDFGIGVAAAHAQFAVLGAGVQLLHETLVARFGRAHFNRACGAGGHFVTLSREGERIAAYPSYHLHERPPR
ncbi:hypothetical protein ACHMW6_25965 [Pseudoduganella sp. UC29_106]|uniref:hypothetical protein n=1 Tax=Pseudoduganella sp. UC29_106 TaxID=3374553 RepID=UPI0037570A9D